MRGQKGGLRDRLITNKIINLNIKKRKKEEENIIVEKNKEEQRLKKFLNSLNTKPEKIPKTASNINKIEQNKKGNNYEIEVLDNTIVLEEESIYNISLDIDSPPCSVISTTEARKIQDDIKKGINQYQSEKNIINKVNTIISRAKEEVNALDNDMNALEKELKIEQDTKKITQYEKKLISIQEKVTMLQQKYNIIFENTDFLYFDELNDEDLLDEISRYKFIVDDMEMINDLAHDCRSKIDDLTSIIDVYEKKKKIDKQKDQKKKELEERDEDFHIHKNKFTDIENVKRQIEENYNEQQEFIKKLQDKISKNESKYHDVERLRGLNKLSYNLLKISFLIKAVKKQKIALPIALLMFDDMAKGMNKSLVGKQKKKIFSEYKDLNDDLLNEKIELDSIEGLLNNSLNQVERLKKEINYKFSEYKDFLPEYDNIEKRLNLTIKQLKAKDEQVKKIKDNVSEQYKKNKVKIKKMEVA